MARTKHSTVPACAWTLMDEDEGGNYDTACGQAFAFTVDGPVENGMKFCCYCGKKLQADKCKPEDR